MDSPSHTRSLRHAPIVTVIAAFAAEIIFFSPAAVSVLAFDRTHVGAGQWWRVFTGNWVHFRPSELWWNLAILVPAGVWAERLQPLRARLLYALSPAAIGAIVYFVFPLVDRFAGLSGVAAAVVTFLALVQLRTAETDRWFWRAILGLLALKVATEALLASGRLGGGWDPAMQVIAIIHLTGMCTGALALRQRRPRKS